jgi:hypothetical protein
VYLGICILVTDRILVFPLLISGAAGVSVRAHLPFGVLPRTVVHGVLVRARLAGRLMGNVVLIATAFSRHSLFESAAAGLLCFLRRQCSINLNRDKRALAACRHRRRGGAVRAVQKSVQGTLFGCSFDQLVQCSRQQGHPPTADQNWC